MKTITLDRTSAKFLPAENGSATKSRIYVFVTEGSTTGFFGLPGASRVAAYRKLVSRELGFEPRWDNKAGCFCGCSPGFVLPPEKSFRTAEGKLANLFIDARAVEVAS